MVSRRLLTSEDESLLFAAQQASQSGISELLRVHELKVLTRLVAEYRSVKGLSPESAKTGIAIISELRSLTSYVDRVVERGTTVGRKLTE